MPILGFNYFGKKLRIDLCQIESISECKHMSFIADLLDFRLSPMMHIKIKVFRGILTQNIMKCVVVSRHFTVKFSCQ